MEKIKFWNPPFKKYYSCVYGNEDQFCFMFDFDSWNYEKDIGIKREVIDILNDKTDKKITAKLEIVDGYKIYMNDKPFITIRGWGYLTECGGGLCLDPDVAKKIQDDFVKWIVDKLTK